MRILLLVPALAAVVLGAVPASAAPVVANASVIGEAPAPGDPDDFTFASFDATYSLDVDEDGRSVLRVVETLVAEFPQADQNRGIFRVLVDTYDGHPTDLEVISVEDGNGEQRAYEEDGGDDGIELTIADDDHVTGEQTYVITYEQHNVTRSFADTGADEFYWDVNGVDWAQPFDTVTATVELTPELTSTLTGEVDAASGVEGADGPADIETTGSGFRFSAGDLGPGENLSFSIGFEEGTFVPRDSSFTASPWPLLALLSAIGTVLAAVGAFVFRRRRLRDAPSPHPIVAQYLPPGGASVLLSSVVTGTTSKVPTAQILALAVAGNLRIVDADTGRKKPSYRLEYLTDAHVDQDGRKFLHTLFGAELTAGESRKLEGTNTKVSSRISKLMSKVSSDAAANGYRRALPAGGIAGVVIVALIASVAAFVFSVIALGESYGGALPVLFLIVGLLGGVVAIIFVSRHPLDTKGVELRDHLRGLKLYIETAEADRIRFLQSPQGAERVPVDTDDEAQVIELNERLLPYAVLFGQEKQWIEELGRHYEHRGTSPGWYYGHAPFNAAVFSSGLSSVATSVSSYSSSSGGSTGGAVSGGGGGGGGGGGV